MIYVHPVGGLGNMLFHIASIYSLAKDNDDDLCLINIDKKIADLKNDGRADMSHADVYRYIFDRFPQINGKFPIIKYPFKYIPLEYKNNYEYEGYFQSEEYFKHKRSELLNLFRPNKQIIQIIDNYSNIYNNISLHVRRNDYVKLYPQIHVPQELEYYKKALDMLPKDLTVVVFSDDIEWCKNNFIDDRFIFIDEYDYICIYLMAKMKYHIIANSSFSWWGAWLCNINEKKIIAPKNWFGGKKKGFDINMNIIPNNWTRI